MYPDSRKPMEEVTLIFKAIGWEKRLCDLTEQQVQALIFGLQNAEKIEEEINIGKLEDTYYESTGVTATTSIPF
jgi:hypothetical protein|tara:strand:- start:394 stop:615 length:222 start_codon:yes stop_codon:yes gene_type:complete